MKLVVDTNIVFSAMLNPESTIGDILLNSEGILELYTGHSLREEIEEHRDRILSIARCSSATFEEIKFLIFNQLRFVAEPIIPFEFWQRAAFYVRDADMDDIPFVALSLFLGCKLWTGDKKLLEGLAAKGYTEMVSTSDVREVLRASRS